ncbi:MAG: caspase family protein [Terriglobales bacterium]
MLCNLKDKDWAVLTHAGRFDASANGMELMHWRLGSQAIRLNQLKRGFYEPGLLAKVMGLNKQPLRKISSLQDVKLFPDVTCEPVNAEHPQLVVKLKNRGGGIGQIEVRVNGKEVAEDASPRGLDRDAQQATVSVDLSNAATIAGAPNEITVIAHNRNGDLSSRAIRLTFTPKAVSSRADINVYAIIGGVSHYADPELDLKYSGKDATDIAKGIELGAKKLFGADRVHVTLLSSLVDSAAGQPTKENFASAFDTATAAKPQDILIVYLAGHGTTLAMGEDKYYYLTADSKKSDLSSLKLLERSAISSEQLAEWVKKVPALKQILILDTCAAGAACAKLTERRDIPGDQIRAIDRLKDRVGFYVLMGCAADAVSYETSRYGQGVLT